MVMISESDIIRFLRRCGNSFVDVTDFFSQLGIKFFAGIICNKKISVTLLSVIMILQLLCLLLSC